MKRSLSLGVVALLVLSLTAGLVFAKPPTTSKPSQSKSGQTSKKSSGKSMGGKKMSGKKMSGKKSSGKKSGMKKHPKHHKHHVKHHRHHQKGGSILVVDRDTMDRDTMLTEVDSGNAGAADTGADDGDDPEVDGGNGLQITEVEENGPAADAGLEVDDVILSVNGVRVQTVEELRLALKKVKGPVTVVYISDESGDTEEVEVTPTMGKLGIAMEEVELDADDK